VILWVAYTQKYINKKKQKTATNAKKF